MGKGILCLPKKLLPGLMGRVEGSVIWLDGSFEGWLGSKPPGSMCNTSWSMRQCGFWTRGTVCVANDIENSVYEIDEPRKLFETMVTI